jgi:hypothetical protein
MSDQAENIHRLPPPTEDWKAGDIATCIEDGLETCPNGFCPIAGQSYIVRVVHTGLGRLAITGRLAKRVALEFENCPLHLAFTAAYFRKNTDLADMITRAAKRGAPVPERETV